MPEKKQDTFAKQVWVGLWDRQPALPTAGEWRPFPGQLAPELAHFAGGREGEKLLVMPPFSFPGQPEPLPHEGLEQFLAAGCRLAKELQVNLIPGSMLVEEAAGLYHRAYFISRDGEVAGCCGQTHVTPQEREAGWQMGQELPLLDTPLGKVAILLSRDCWQPEVWRLVTLAGAELVVALTLAAAPYSEEQQLAGVWQNLQQNQVLGVETGYQGRWQGQAYQSRPGLFAPCEMTPGFTGRLTAERQGGLLVCRLDFARLVQVRRDYPLLAQLNIPLYQAQLLPLYPGWQQAGGEK